MFASICPGGPVIRCLELRDTFELIVRALLDDDDKCSVVCLAITNRSLSTMALPLLWEDLDGLDPLLKLLPDDKWTTILNTTDPCALPEHQIPFLRRLSGRNVPVLSNPQDAPVDLRALQKYSSYIKYVRWVCFCNACMRAWALLFKSVAPGSRLFPGVRMISLPRITFPRISGIKHREAPAPDGQCGLPTADDIGRFLAQCDPSRVKRLQLPCMQNMERSKVEVTPSHPALTVIKSFTLLRELLWSAPLTFNGFSDLSDLPLRHVVWFPQAVNFPTEGTESPCVREGFITLEALAMAFTVSRISSFQMLSTVRFPGLKMLSASIDSAGEEDVDLALVLSMVPSMPWAGGLTKLILDMRVQYASDGLTPLKIVRATDMRPLLDLVGLTHLVISMECFDLDAAFMKDLAHAMVRLRLLRLVCKTPKDDVPRVPLSALLPLAEHCRDLELLSLDIEAPDDVYAIPPEFLPQNSVKTLAVNRGYVKNPEAVAKYLRALFPALSSLRFQVQSNITVLPRCSHQWMEVRQMIESGRIA